MARRVIPKRHGRAADSNAPLTIEIEGGMPGCEHLDTRLTVLTDTGRMRRIRVLGGLPDVLQGTLMTAAERKAHDNETYAAIFGGSTNHQFSTVAPTSTEEKS